MDQIALDPLPRIVLNDSFTKHMRDNLQSPAHIYGRRLRHTRRKGIETTGLERAVQLLAEDEQPVRLGQIKVADGPWAVMVFLDHDGRSLVACTGVRQSEPSQLRPDASVWPSELGDPEQQRF